MGRVIGLLLLLNAVVLAAGLSMERLRGQPAALVDFNADKVRLLGRVERSAAAESTSEEGVDAAVVTAPLVARCLSWSGLDEGLLDEIESRMRDAGIAVSSYDIQLRKRLGWWVYLPPFANAEAALAAIDAARQKGVKDIALVRAGERANAVSLGAFPTLANARAQMDRLRTLGIEGARKGPRPNAGPARLTLAGEVSDAKLTGLDQGWGKGRVPVACSEN